MAIVMVHMFIILTICIMLMIMQNLLSDANKNSDMCNVHGKCLYNAGMDAPPRGEGGVPRPAPHCGEGGVPRPTPPRKNDQNRGEVAGQNKGPNLNFLQ